MLIEDLRLFRHSEKWRMMKNETLLNYNFDVILKELIDEFSHDGL